MAVDKNSFFQYVENRGQAGYGAAILVKKQNESYYSLLVASETVPSVFGSQDSFEFDILNSPVKGKIQGKMTLDDKEVEVLHHRDNVYRFENLKGHVLDFLVVDANFVGYKFTGTVSYRMNDATADVLRGTYTITPMSADPTPILNARPLCQETLCFADVVPETVKAGEKITLSVSNKIPTSTTVTYTAKIVGEDSDASGVITNNVFTAPSATGGGKIYAITASATGYASWTTTVYVE